MPGQPLVGTRTSAWPSRPRKAAPDPSPWRRPQFRDAAGLVSDERWATSWIPPLRCPPSSTGWTGRACLSDHCRRFAKFHHGPHRTCGANEGRLRGLSTMSCLVMSSGHPSTPRSTLASTRLGSWRWPVTHDQFSVHTEIDSNVVPAGFIPGRAW